MPTLWTYPWGLYNEGLDDAMADLSARGIDAVSMATHYHSVGSYQPRTPDSMFERYAGGCYFDPDPAFFEDTPIDPIPNEIDGAGDPLGEVAETASNHGLATKAWTVVFHNSRLGREYPEYRLQDAFDHPHEHAFCPSHEEVRSYFEGVVGNIAEYPVESVELESVGYHTALHGHDTTFGHPKRQVLTSDTEEWLFSQCFCEACRERADLDMDRAQEAVREIVENSFAEPHSDPPTLGSLLQERPVLADLFDFRAEVVSGLLERLAEASDAVDLDCYLMDGFGVEAGDGWPAGVRLADVNEHCDRATAICYVSDPSVARERLRTLKRRLDVPIDAGVTLDPDLIGSEGELHALLDAVRAEATGDVSIYHHTLATEAQLDWIERGLD